MRRREVDGDEVRWNMHDMHMGEDIRWYGMDGLNLFIYLAFFASPDRPGGPLPRGWQLLPRRVGQLEYRVLREHTGVGGRAVRFSST